MKRRTFVKQSMGVAATSLVVNPFNIISSQDQKLGVALIGLGNYARGKLEPAFEYTKYCRLAGIVTGTPEKAKEWSEKHNIPQKNVYNYETFPEIADNPEIDFVYVVLPNGLHAEYTIKAAAAGKHVICEKPMEVSVERAQAMIDACEKAGKLLQIGYRCQYDPYHQELMRIGQEKVLGELRVIRTGDSFYGVKGNNWRYTDKSLSGGGPLMDVGVYCIEGVRYTTGKEPVAVRATGYRPYPDLMPGMEQTLVFEMEYENGLVASAVTSYCDRSDFIHVSAEQGNFGLEPGFGYAPIKGYIKREAMDFPYENQQARQMDAFARNIMDGTPVIANGYEGLRDMKIVEALYTSMRAGGERIPVF